MASKLVNTTLSGISQGVTQQYQQGRFDSQVTSMVNCMPSITRGVLRRNPLKGIKMLEGLSNLSEVFSYSYDRGTPGEQYLIVCTGNGYIRTYNINTGDLVYTSNYSSYLDISTKDITANKAFKALTLGDHTFIVNTTVEVSLGTSEYDSTKYRDATLYWIKKTASVIVSQKQQEVAGAVPPEVETGSHTLGYTYTLNNMDITGETDSRPGEPQIDLGSSYSLIAEFIDRFAVQHPNIVVRPITEQDKAIGYSLVYDGPEFTWSDSFGNEASFGVRDVVDDSSKLPATLPKELDGFKVRVSGGTSSSYDDYYLQYYHDSKSWREIPKPGSKYLLDDATMPHVLYRLTTGFKFDTYKTVNSSGDGLLGSAWGPRTSGQEDPLQDPSFLGKSIVNIFFYKNRLGMLTSDSILLSATGDYGVFFPHTVTDVLDDDVIDLSVASTDVTILRDVVPTAGQLLIFSDDTQFVLQSSDGPITPNTAYVSALSNYTYNTNSPAKAIGGKVYFNSLSGGYSQLLSYRVDGGSNYGISEASNMTIHIPTYLPNSVDSLIGHDVIGYIFSTYTSNKKELIVLTTVSKNSEDLQNAFHKWEFSKDIASIHIINTQLYILFRDGELATIVLEIPGDIGDVVYEDSHVDAPELYSSNIKFSEFFLRDSAGKGTERGRYQLRTLLYSVTENSKFTTTISNKNQSLYDPTLMYGHKWSDKDTWEDSLLWLDSTPYYTREYTDTNKITIMSASDKADIVFKESKDEPTEGFELATLNIEAFFHQRSTRA